MCAGMQLCVSALNLQNWLSQPYQTWHAQHLTVMHSLKFFSTPLGGELLPQYTSWASKASTPRYLAGAIPSIARHSTSGGKSNHSLHWVLQALWFGDSMLMWYFLQSSFYYALIPNIFENMFEQVIMFSKLASAQWFLYY